MYFEKKAKYMRGNTKNGNLYWKTTHTLLLKLESRPLSELVDINILCVQ